MFFKSHESIPKLSDRYFIHKNMSMPNESGLFT